MNYSKKCLYFCLFLGICLLGLPKQSCAQRFQSNSFVIEWGNFNMTGGTKSSTNYHLTDTVGQMAPGQYDNSSYTIQAGFQYIYNTFNKFRFSINDPDLTIDFGNLTPNIGTTASHSISISCPAGHGYQIMARQNHPLSITNSGITIPDTSCNIGSTCTPSSSAIWNTTNSYGFGYNTIGTDANDNPSGIGTSQYFSDINYYRPFSTIAQYIMAETKPVNNRNARVTYKVLIPSSQSSGKYNNSIIFIAVPNY
jgi:hypothetical protein